ncbi:TPA: tyrosine-protein kinase, partial [Escherichia coli]|nr:tyrosine-protein kinase [Escherichia coli]
MPSLTNKPQTKDNDEIDLGRLVGEFIDHRKLIVSVTSLFTLVALIYAFLATPIYQSDALIQVEQKQGNAILSNLSQMLPDSQPQSAPEIALIQSRMILGKTVDDLTLQAKVKQDYFPIIGKGLARLLGNKSGSLDITHLYISDANSELYLTVKENGNYELTYNGVTYKSAVGILFD